MSMSTESDYLNAYRITEAKKHISKKYQDLNYSRDARRDLLL